MAATKEEVSIISIDTSPASLRIKDLKNNIKLLKEALDEATIGTTDYQDKLNELKLNQNALKDAMYATSASLDQVVESASGAGESYNALVHRMAALKAELRNTDTSTEEGMKKFKELAGQINNVNDKLKNLDAAQGNYQRNVGNYESALNGLSSSFKATAGAAGSMIQPIAGATMGLKAMSATPVVAILGLLANVINQVVSSLKSSEENMNAAKMEMSAFSGVATIFKNIMQTLGSAVGWVAKQINTLALKAIPSLRKAAEAQNAITQKTIDLSYKQREAVEKNADAELEIAKLRQKAVDKENYSAEERIAYLEKANALELEISQRNKEIAEQEYEIAQMNSKIAKNSKEENDALAQAYAKKVNAETEYYKKARELTSQLVKARKEARSEVEAAEKAQLQSQVDQANEYMNYWLRFSQERARSIVEAVEGEMMALDSLINGKRAEKREELKKQFGNDAAFLKTLLEDWEQKEFGDQKLALAEKFADAQDELVRLHMEAQTEIVTSGSIKRMKKEEELARWEWQNIISRGQKIMETEQQFNDRRELADAIYQEKKRARIEAEIGMYQSYGASVGAVFSSIADIYEADDALAEKNAKRIKALRIAEATINTISGAVGAFMGITKDTGGWGIAEATLQAAAVMAAGMAQIQKIRNTKIGSSGTSSSSSSSTSASVSAPIVSADVQSVRYLTSASEEQRLNDMTKDRRVVLVMSDLEVAQNQVRVQTAEASF